MKYIYNEPTACFIKSSIFLLLVELFYIFGKNCNMQMTVSVEFCVDEFSKTFSSGSFLNCTSDTALYLLRKYDLHDNETLLRHVWDGMNNQIFPLNFS